LTAIVKPRNKVVYHEGMFGWAMAAMAKEHNIKQ